MEMAGKQFRLALNSRASLLADAFTTCNAHYVQEQMCAALQTSLLPGQR